MPHLQHPPAKILLFLLLLTLFESCNLVKRVPEGEHLLKENIIEVNGEEVRDNVLASIPYLQKNNNIQLAIYNIPRPNLDSILQARLIENESARKFWTAVLSRKQLDAYINFKLATNRAIRNTGEAPTLITAPGVRGSAARFEEYYHSNGWFNAKADFDITRDSLQKTGKVTYAIKTGEGYLVDSLKTFIDAPAADSIYKKNRSRSLIRVGEQYHLLDINAETTRLTELFRNNGLFHFDRENISFIGDTVQTGHKVNLELYVGNRKLKNTDSIYDEPWQVHHISKVNVYTDYNYNLRNNNINERDSINGYQILAYDEINYKPKYLTDAIFIKPTDLYSDRARNESLIRLSQLGIFRYPDLRYTEDPDSPDGTDLIANLYLTPLPKFKLSANFDVITSDIRRIGIGGGGGLIIRNVFGGLETLRISGRGSIGASYSENKNSLFDITELGADLSLNIPRIVFPLTTKSFIAPEMGPFTNVTFGVGSQRNIGLDKQNVTGGVNYQWKPSRNLDFRYDLFDVQYIRNLNVRNYFNVYQNSYQDLNAIALENLSPENPFFETDANGNPQLSIPDGARGFISDVRNGTTTVTQDERDEINSIAERRQRLTEDNLILASAFTYVKNTRSGLFDEEFTNFRVKLELAGNLLDLVSSAANLERNANGNSKVFGVTFSQYVRPEVDFIKHWDFGNDNILAFRAFGGIAIPYGNSNSIPFIRSYFAGGPNDNRAWQAYRLGPGSTDSPDDFNEANFKLAFNIEQRFRVFADLKGAIFIDAGNIWNALDNIDDPRARFQGLTDLQELAVGSGFGLRYDFGFFVLRGDVGFKTYNPANEIGEKWFNGYKVSKAVLNVGINYPF
ncbi:MAG: BamA/TamA family outer membrane protein [Leeuwenhoekiella sp.]